MIAEFIILEVEKASREELETITEKLFQLLSIKEKQKMKQFFHSFHYHYAGVQPNEVLNDIYNIYEVISNKRMVSFYYQKNEETTYREVIPYSLTFIMASSICWLRKKNISNLLPGGSTESLT
jgi:predicted DNA-binding transcriptional regulator YafY